MNGKDKNIPNYELEMDIDVKAVLSFMQRNIPADKLVSVSSSISKIAPCLWDRHKAIDIVPLSLTAPPIV